MGKLRNSKPGDENVEKKRQDLEKIRRVSLAAKRNQRIKFEPDKKPKSSFMKVLNRFSNQRSEIEEATKTHDLLLKDEFANSVSDRQSRMVTRGFFRRGLKGKEITHATKTQEKFKEAVLNNDALKLFQSCSSVNSMPFINKNTRKHPNAVDIRKDWTDNDPSILCRESTNIVTFSPILGKNKSLKKTDLLVSEQLDSNSQLHKKIANIPNGNKIMRENNNARQLEKVSNGKINKKNVITGKNDYVSQSFQKLTPENVIIFTDDPPKKSTNNQKNVQPKQKLDPHNPHLVKCYIQTCKIIAKKNLEDINNNYEDPLKEAKGFLTDVYSKVLTDYIDYEQKSDQGFHSGSRSTCSSNSEILLEPDSVITRAVRRNNCSQDFNDSSSLGNNSKVFVQNVDELSSRASTVENTHQKRKRTPSSIGDDSKSENVDYSHIKYDLSKLKEKEALRYVDKKYSNTALGNENDMKEQKQQLDKTKLSIPDNYNNLISKNKVTKHIPAILRKNRQFAEDFIKDTVSMNKEKHHISENVVISQDHNNKKHFISERSPNCGNMISSELTEAPNCKHVYMNAKYNQPARISMPLGENQAFQKNSLLGRHLFDSPIKVENSFILQRNIEISPISQPFKCSQNSNQDYNNYQLSQENSKSEHNMGQMNSFGDIQNLTDLLSIQSSQGQSSSQNNSNYFTTLNGPKSDSSFYINQQYQTYDNPISRNHEQEMNSKFTINFKNNQALSHNGNFQDKMCQHCMCHSSKNRSFPVNRDLIIPESQCQQNTRARSYCECNTIMNQQCQQNTAMTIVPKLYQQNSSQAIKFAADGERLPIRRPIYNPNDSQRSLFHKNNQVNSLMQNCCPNNETVNQLNPKSILKFQNRPALMYSNIDNSSQCVSSNYNEEMSRNFALQRIANQNYMLPQSNPLHEVRCPPLYAHVKYQHCNQNNQYDHHYVNNSEGYHGTLNNAYFQEMGHHVYTQRE